MGVYDLLRRPVKLFTNKILTEVAFYRQNTFFLDGNINYYRLVVFLTSYICSLKSPSGSQIQHVQNQTHDVPISNTKVPSFELPILFKGFNFI